MLAMRKHQSIVHLTTILSFTETAGHCYALPIAGYKSGHLNLSSFFNKYTFSDFKRLPYSITTEYNARQIFLLASPTKHQEKMIVSALSTLLPDVLATEDFHTYIINFITTTRFEDFHAQALCANTEL
jgi:hypothetical protein